MYFLRMRSSADSGFKCTLNCYVVGKSLFSHMSNGHNRIISVKFCTRFLAYSNINCPKDFEPVM